MLPMSGTARTHRVCAEAETHSQRICSVVAWDAYEAVIVFTHLYDALVVDVVNERCGTAIRIGMLNQKKTIQFRLLDQKDGTVETTTIVNANVTYIWNTLKSRN